MNDRERALGERVVAAIGDEPGAVLVAGDGPDATSLRARFPGTPAEPNVVIETTGRAAGVQAALETVASLGIVVLAGPVPDDPPMLDLYRDLHVRGLTIIGVSTVDPSGD